MRTSPTTSIFALRFYSRYGVCVIQLGEMPGLLISPLGRRRLIVEAIDLLSPAILKTAELYRRFALRRTRVVAVVGSFGKSTTMRALATGICGGIHKYAEANTPSFAAHAVLRTRPGDAFAVVEAAINAPGLMEKHARVLQPDIAVVTAIGTEHHRSLGTLEVTRSEKGKMVEALRPSGFAILNGDDENVLWMRNRCRGHVITFGLSGECDVRGTDVHIDWPHGMRFEVRYGGVSKTVETRLIGPNGVRAVLATVAVARAADLDVDRVLGSLRDLEPTDGRLQPIVLANNVTVLRDDYKSALETVHSALDVFADLPARRKICVLGGVSEPPGSQGPIYRELGARVASFAAEFVVIGNAFQRYAAGASRAGMPREKIHEAGYSARRAAEILESIIQPGDAVLIKGRDTERLERVTMLLQGKTVECDIGFCNSGSTRCRNCRLLETGWGKRKPVM